MLKKEEVEKRIKEYMNKNGHFPKYEVLNKIVSQATIRRLYGSSAEFHKIFEEWEWGEIKELNYSKSELIKYLQNGIDSGEIVSSRFFKQKGHIELSALLRRLECKTWEDALILVNRKDLIKEKIDYIKKEIVEKYLILSEKLNREFGASKTDIKENLKYNIDMITYLFGGMTGLREEAGISNIYKTATIDYNKLIEEVKKLYKEKGYLTETQLRKELKERGLASYNTVRKAFKITKLSELYDILKKNVDIKKED